MEVREASARYIRTTGYKQTEVGVIPEDWDVRKLLSVVRSHNSGIYKSQSLYGHGCNIVGVSDIYGVDKVDGQSFAAVPLSSQERTKHTLQCGDLLYGESSLVREGIARTVYVTESGTGTAFAWHTRRYSIDQRTLLSQYLYYYLQSRPARAHMINHSIQTAITGINTVAYFACPIIVPPVAEQEAIAEALSDADALIESLEQLLAKKRHLKQGAMQQLLTGKKRLPGFSGEWEVSTFGDMFNITAGGDVDSKRTIFYQDQIHRYPIYSNALTDYGLYGYCSYADHQAGSITVTARGTLGFANFRDHAHTAIGRVLVLHPKQESDGRFFAEVINNCIKFAVESTGVPQLTAPQISTYRLPVPPLPEQSAIATILSDMDAELAALEEKLAKARVLKQGMMQELLTGRIRLV